MIKLKKKKKNRKEQEKLKTIKLVDTSVVTKKEK